MVDWVQVQEHIDRGRGMAAVRLGQPYNVFRVQANGAVNYLDTANQIATNIPVLRRISGGAKANIEAPVMAPLIFEAVGDMTEFEVGDVFIQNDPVYGAGATQVSFSTQQFNAFAIAQHAPVKKTVAGRIDHLGQVYRSASGPDASGYYRTDQNATLPLMLSDGVFALGTNGQTAALIPVGIQSQKRWRGDLFRDLPAATSEIVYFAYVPALPGFTFREADRLVLQDGSRYVVQNPYEQEAGFSGSQLVLSREISQP